MGCDLEAFPWLHPHLPDSRCHRHPCSTMVTAGHWKECPRRAYLAGSKEGTEIWAYTTLPHGSTLLW